MTATEAPLQLPVEAEEVQRRARAYVLVRLAVDVMLLALFLIEPPSSGLFPAHWIFIADGLCLLLYWLGVRRWPGSSTYLVLVVAAVLLIGLDFSLGAITFVPWLFLVPLSLAGGLIVARTGFNSLVTLSLVGLYAAYTGLILFDLVPLPLTLPPDQFLTLAAATGFILMVLNALVEALIVHLFQTQENLVQTQVQLLHTLTELEQSRYQLFDVQRQARRAERLSAIGDIAGQISQSLRMPLAAFEKVIGHPEDLPAQSPNDPLEAEPDDNSDTIVELRNQLSAALRMTDGLRSFAELGHIQVQTVNLDDLLSDELSRLQLPPNVSLHVEQPPVFPPIQADRKHMRLLVHHLLDNAIYAASETKGGKVTVKLAPNPEGIRLSVIDTGPGIPPDQLRRIFEPLYTTHRQGFGLGLAICQQVVRMHGGRIHVKSAVGEGTTFSVYLPRIPRHPPEELAQDMAG